MFLYRWMADVMASVSMKISCHLPFIKMRPTMVSYVVLQEVLFVACGINSYCANFEPANVEKDKGI